MVHRWDRRLPIMPGRNQPLFEIVGCFATVQSADSGLKMKASRLRLIAERLCSRPSSRKRRHRNSFAGVERVCESLEDRILLTPDTAIPVRSTASGVEDTFAEMETDLQQADIDVVFFGDSLVYRWRLEGDNIWNDSFLPNRTIVNAGHGGFRTQHVLWRMQNSSLGSANPKVVVLHVGTNNLCWPQRGNCVGEDTAADTVIGIEANIDTIRETVPDAEILVLGVLPRNEATSPLRPEIAAVNSAMSVIAEQRDQVHFLDIGGEYVDETGTLIDGMMFDDLHLTEEGYEVMAAAIRPTLDWLTGYGEMTVSQNSNPLQVRETGTTETFDVQLTTQPLGDVMVSVASGNAKEFSVSQSSLTFSTTNWDQPQSVTVTGMDDDELDGKQAASIIVSIDPVSTETYAPADSILVSVENMDVEENVSLVGTTGNDSIRFERRENSYFLSINGEHFEFEADNPDISIDGMGGVDSLMAIGGTGDEIGSLAYTSLELQGDDYDLSVVNTARINVKSGGGRDEIEIRDSAADDTIIMKPTVSYMKSDDAYLAAHGFYRVMALGGIGRDVARLFDSPGDDFLTSTPTTTTLVGDSFYLLASGFEYTSTDGRAGGYNHASLFDSLDDDMFVAKPDVSYMKSAAFYNVVRYFQNVSAFSTEGNDEAQFYDQDTENHMTALTSAVVSHATKANGERVNNTAQNFGYVRAWAHQDNDRLDVFSNLDYLFSWYGDWDVNE